MMRRIAVVGDQLNTGGQIMPYTGPVFAWGDGGRQVALIGGNAYCETCKRIGTIAKSGGPRRINFMGETAADGDIVLCNCGTPPRIVAKLAGDSWCDDTDYTAVAPSANTARYATTQANAAYDEQYTLTDDTGRPLSGVRYRVRADSNVVSSGLTDASGRTDRISTNGSQRLWLEIAH